MTVLGLVPQTQIQLPHLTAIDDEDLARDEARAGAGEEGGGVGDFLDRAEAAERDFAPDPALPGFRALLRVLSQTPPSKRMLPGAMALTRRPSLPVNFASWRVK